MKEHHLELRGRMRAKCVTQATIAQKSHTSLVYISQRFNGKAPWSYDMILDICELCEIDPAEIPMYFERSAKT